MTTMKQTTLVAVFCMLAIGANTLSVGNHMEGDRTITRVVKLLEGMLETSKAESEAEATAYAKYMCDCDKRITEYKTTIKKEEETIVTLANDNAELKAANAKLSTECAELKEAMAENTAAREEAAGLRTKENQEFVAEEADLKEAIDALQLAIETLEKVSADQTEVSGADHTKFMAGYKSPVSLLNAKSSLKQALSAASALMDEKTAKKVSSFIQAPFTGSYTSQSVAIMGILKDMMDTFKSNRAGAITEEKKDVEDNTEFMDAKQGEYDTMSASYDKKQAQMAENDIAMSTKKDQKEAAKANLAEAQQFLTTTEEMCSNKKKEYSKRRMLQAGEEAAITEAISILNSDEAFATFGTVSATSTGALGAFVQLKSIQKHTKQEVLRSQLMQILKKAKGSKRISKLESLVQAENVFAVVLEEIDKMLALIEEEGKSDTVKLDFCNSERTKNDKLVAEKSAAIDALTLAITNLKDDIMNPDTGLKKQIADTEESLLQNAANQQSAGEDRKEENLMYQQDIKNLVDAQAILKRAIGVLDAYYTKLEAAVALLQKQSATKRNTPVPTEDTAVLKMQGESASGKGVITKLQFILSETAQEETDATADEKKAQEEYEKEMKQLGMEEVSLQTNLAKLQSELATAEESLLTKSAELKTTKEEHAAAEAYLSDMKPGCDFITTNYDLRVKNRADETTALNQAVTLIKGTPEYMSYEAEVHAEGLGKCKDTCEASGEADVRCKACLADVTVVAYCAGHPGTTGCE